MCKLIQHKVLLFSTASPTDSEETTIKANLFEIQKELESLSAINFKELKDIFVNGTSKPFGRMIEPEKRATECQQQDLKVYYEDKTYSEDGQTLIQSPTHSLKRGGGIFDPLVE